MSGRDKKPEVSHQLHEPRGGQSHVPGRQSGVGRFGSSWLITQISSGALASSNAATSTAQPVSAVVQRQEGDAAANTPTDRDALIQVLLEQLEDRVAGTTDRAYKAQLSRAIAILLMRPDLGQFTNEEQAFTYLAQLLEDCEVEDQAAAFDPDAPFAFPDAFPETWSEEVYRVMDLGFDLTPLANRRDQLQAERDRLLEDAMARIAREGLPVDLQQALELDSFDLDAPWVTANPDHPLAQLMGVQNRFAALYIAAAFVTQWESGRGLLRDSVREGNSFILPDDVDDFEQSRGVFVSHLDEMLAGALDGQEALTALEEDLNLITATGIASFVAGSAIGLASYEESWRQARADIFARVAELDAEIAGLSDEDRLLRALDWMVANDYAGSVGQAFLTAIQEHGVQLLLETAGILALQLIPGVNVLVDTVLIAMGGIDTVLAADEIVRALQQVFRAQSTVELQQSSAAVATAAVNAGVVILPAIIGLGAEIRRFRNRVRRIRAANPDMPAAEVYQQALREHVARAPDTDTETESGSGRQRGDSSGTGAGTAADAAAAFVRHADPPSDITPEGILERALNDYRRSQVDSYGGRYRDMDDWLALYEDGLYYDFRGHWQRFTRGGSPIPRGLSASEVLALLDDTSFGPYRDMLARTGIADEAAILARLDEIGGAGRYPEIVGHELKKEFRREVMDYLTEEGLDQAQSYARLTEVTDGLNNADRGYLTERWYQAMNAPGAERQVSMPIPNTERVRIADLIDPSTGVLHEIKSVTGQLAERDQVQIQDYVDAMLDPAYRATLRGGQDVEISEVRVTFTSLDGARANWQWIRDFLGSYPDEAVVIEIFDNSGRARLLDARRIDPGDLRGERSLDSVLEAVP